VQHFAAGVMPLKASPRAQCAAARALQHRACHLDVGDSSRGCALSSTGTGIDGSAGMCSWRSTSRRTPSPSRPCLLRPCRPPCRSSRGAAQAPDRHHRRPASMRKCCSASSTPTLLTASRTHYQPCAATDALPKPLWAAAFRKHVQAASGSFTLPVSNQSHCIKALEALPHVPSLRCLAVESLSPAMRCG
jgi:hypothetical protein